MTPRTAGLLLHPTSLPGAYGIGDLGPSAWAFLEKLSAAGLGLWQMLPLQTPGHLGSPYSAQSAFALNPMLISPELLERRGHLSGDDLRDLATWVAAMGRPRQVDFLRLPTRKSQLLHKAFETWTGAGEPEREAFEAFCQQHHAWLEGFCLYAALRDAHQGRGWQGWGADLIARHPGVLAQWQERLAQPIREQAYLQWITHGQLAELTGRAKALGIELVGDVPIFVAMDSADVWERRELFKLDALGRTDVVAGVPPDYFSPTGQKWGNPLFDWDACAAQGYDWWIKRIAHAAATFDLIRIDHFRGFESYWETPAHTPDAIDGQWVKGPGDAFFEAIRGALGELPFLAEDLGDISDEVFELRDRQGLPGMKVMHFGFSQDPDHPFLPHTYPSHCVAYTGTHDNDTTRGWFDALSDREKHDVRMYLGSHDMDVVWKMIEALFGSDARWVVVPMQDLLGLGTAHRMNTPATVEGNWAWRMLPQEMEHAGWERIRSLAERYGRGAV